MPAWASGSRPANRGAFFQGPGEPSGAGSVEIGAALLETGQAGRAVPHFENAVRLEAGNVRARHLLALALHRDQQLGRAVEEFQAAIALDPSDEALYLDYAEVFRTGNLVDEAEALLIRTVEIFPLSRAVRVRLGGVQFDAGKIEDALASYQAASQLEGAPDLDPASEQQEKAEIEKSIGDMYVHLIRFDEALLAYSMALEADEASLTVRLSLGRLYLRRNRLEEAMAEYRRVASRDPLNMGAFAGIAEASLRLGRHQEAIEAAERVLAGEPRDLAARYTRAMALIRSGREEEGRTALEEYRVLEIEAREAEYREREIGSYYKAGVARLIEGDAEAAIASFRDGLAIYPDSAELHFNLGLVQGSLGMHPEAIRTFLRMIELGVGDAPAVHRSLSGAYEALGDADKSETHRKLYLEGAAW